MSLTLEQQSLGHQLGKIQAVQCEDIIQDDLPEVNSVEQPSYTA